jgi:hypothetical protein
MKKISQNRGFTRQNFSSKNSGGFMQIVILAIVIIATLAYFNVDLHALTQNPFVHKIISILNTIWDDYIFPILKFVGQYISNLMHSVSDTATSTATSTIPVAGN